MALATVWIDGVAEIHCDNEAWLSLWRQRGVVGRAARGRLYPSDGQAFLDELPFVYRSAYCWASPEGDHEV